MGEPLDANMRAHEINELNNFIGGWYLEDTSICDRIIQWHNETPTKREGQVSTTGVNKSVKNSIDSNLINAPLELANSYYSSLQTVVNQYIEKYKFCDWYAKWSVLQGCNIQQYPHGGGFYGWHCERTSAAPVISQRHLVFMTYLNDISDAGETEFYYQKLKIKPEKGLTLIWPTDWTFTHRGIPSPSQEKIVATGWFSYTM